MPNEKELIDPMTFDTEEDTKVKKQEWENLFLRHPDLSDKILDIYKILGDNNMDIFSHFVYNRYDTYYDILEIMILGKAEDDGQEIDDEKIPDAITASDQLNDAWNLLACRHPSVAYRLTWLFNFMSDKDFEDIGKRLDKMYGLTKEYPRDKTMPIIDERCYIELDAINALEKRLDLDIDDPTYATPSETSWEWNEILGDNLELAKKIIYLYTHLGNLEDLINNLEIVVKNKDIKNLKLDMKLERKREL